MKKTLFTFGLCLITLCSYSNPSGPIPAYFDTTTFYCSNLAKDIKYYNHFEKKYSDGSQMDRWAMGIKTVYPKDESDRLHFSYIMKTDAVLNIEKVKKICNDWYDEIFPYCQIFSVEKNDNCIKGRGKYEILSELPISAGKRVTNHALVDIVISFKENRIKLDIIGCQYQFYIEYSGNRTIINYYTPGSVWPFVEEYKIYNSSEFAESYINSQYVFAESYIMFCNRSISLACSLINYLNKNIYVSTIPKDEDW